jgi:hypothetical protein
VLVLLLTSLAGAVIVGLLRGGRLRRLEEVALHRRAFVIGAVAAQLAAAWSPSRWLGLVLLATSALLVGAFVAANRGVPGLGLVLLGLVANTLAITANGARMPVSAQALDRVGQSVAVLEGDPLHRVAGPGTHLRALTDWVAVSSPLRTGSGVTSPGDVLVVAGAALLVEQGVQRGGGALRRRPGRAGQPAVS